MCLEEDKLACHVSYAERVIYIYFLLIFSLASGAVSRIGRTGLLKAELRRIMLHLANLWTGSWWCPVFTKVDWTVCCSNTSIKGAHCLGFLSKPVDAGKETEAVRKHLVQQEEG